MKRVAIYVRVSTDGQTVANQTDELRAVADKHGWQVVEVFADRGISGTKGRAGRPALDRLLKAVARREVDMVAAWSVDRLGRSLQDLVGILGELNAKGVDLFLMRQGLDTSTPSGRAMFQMLGVFAEFEAEMIRERVNAGLARAKREGVKLGAPSIAATSRAKIERELKGGASLAEAADIAGVGRSTVHRIATAMRKAGLTGIATRKN